MTEKTNNLKHIKVEGFKSIAKLDLPIENINILIGANGAGKTNLISLFTFLGFLSQGKLRNYVLSDGGAERFFHFGTRQTHQITIDLKVGVNGYHAEFSPNLDDDSLVFSKEYCTITSSSKKWNLYPKKGESGFVSGEQADSELVKKYTREFLEKCRVYHFHDTSNQALFKKTNKLDNHYFLEKDAANIAPFLYSLKISKMEIYRQSYQQIVSAIQTVAPFFHDFYLEPTGEEGDKNILLRWVHAQHDAPFSANLLSDGTARFICLATLFLQPASHRPATIILDEPELGLHPAALAVLADIMQATARETQVICSTQSVEFANFFAPEDFIVVDAKEGVSTFQRLEKEPLKHWLEDYGMGDIWVKNLIGGRPAW
ncbi:MAG: AAA family ATPase [Ectothiorhodospiraceae bacterium]|nr:AAA family ATPase [Ectothiorhodospiraceae bacterium]